MASALISSLEKLIGTPRDGALLRFSLGVEYLKAGDHERAIAALHASVSRDASLSATWKALGRALSESGREPEALEAWTRGIEAARRRGDRQAEKEMIVFSRRLASKQQSKPQA